jgi:hypothetical protein
VTSDAKRWPEQDWVRLQSGCQSRCRAMDSSTAPKSPTPPSRLIRRGYNEFPDGNASSFKPLSWMQSRRTRSVERALRSGRMIPRSVQVYTRSPPQ